MLTELKLTNFRIFDDEVTVRFRPITVFIGENNAGKSSIIKFLLMLQQSLYSDSPHLLQPSGQKVNLGDFHDLKNSITDKKELKFELTVSNDSSIGDAVRNYLESQKIRYDAHQLFYATCATISYDSSSHTVEYDGKLLLNSDEVLAFNRFFDGDNSRLLDVADSLLLEGLDQEGIREVKAQINIMEVLRHNIDAIKHLPAARSEPSKSIESSSPPSGSVGDTGIYTLSHLQKLKDMEDPEIYEFILKHIKDVAGVEDIEFQPALEPLYRCFARNVVTSAKSYIADFGFGVSQCMPIFVQGAIMPKYSHLMIEQPDAQLHLTAQLKMGSFFANLWKRKKVCSVIETHSDNLLLRLRRLVAKNKISHEDISVAYFHYDKKKGPVIDNLDIYEDGTMEDGLPMEFFGANLKEGLKLGARE